MRGRRLLRFPDPEERLAAEDAKDAEVKRPFLCALRVLGGGSRGSLVDGPDATHVII